MGFGHYRIAMAGVSAARAMGFTPYWLDLLAIPGITTDIIGYCKQRLAAYKYPRFVEIVDELPKGPTGKILKRELRD